jgi:hypothetical protein
MVFYTPEQGYLHLPLADKPEIFILHLLVDNHLLFSLVHQEAKAVKYINIPIIIIIATQEQNQKKKGVNSFHIKNGF